MNPAARQPWIHSWYGDFLAFFTVPFLFITLAFFHLPPFRESDQILLQKCIYIVLFIDWAHIFAQYHRIYSNPLEPQKYRWIYPLSYILLIPVVSVLVQTAGFRRIDFILVYFVIFHFIKQHYGFLKIYSKTDGSKSRLEGMTESLLFYLTMVTPVLVWHVKGLDYQYKWVSIFYKSPLFSYLLPVAAGLYLLTLCLYVVHEWNRSRRNGFFNLPKNLALLVGACSWGAASLLPQATSLIIFTVTFTHDISYMFIVWFTGRRDEKILRNEVRWISWYSFPGLLFFFGVLIVLSDVLICIHLEMTYDHNWNYWIWGRTFNFLDRAEGWWLSFAWSIFFATQAHHYFIDRFLWKKEKDLTFMIQTGKYNP